MTDENRGKTREL